MRQLYHFSMSCIHNIFWRFNRVRMSRWVQKRASSKSLVRYCTTDVRIKIVFHECRVCSFLLGGCPPAFLTQHIEYVKHNLGWVRYAAGCRPLYIAAVNLLRNADTIVGVVYLSVNKRHSIILPLLLRSRLCCDHYFINVSSTYIHT